MATKRKRPGLPPVSEERLFFLPFQSFTLEPGQRGASPEVTVQRGLRVLVPHGVRVLACVPSSGAELYAGACLPVVTVEFAGDVGTAFLPAFAPVVTAVELPAGARLTLRVFNAFPYPVAFTGYLVGEG